MFNGSIVALVTPFLNGAIDWESLERLVAWHLESGTAGLAPCGTTGETPTLTHEEHLQVVRRVKEWSKGKIPVMAGCGANSTAKTIELSRDVLRAGADGLLVVTPYYNKPTQAGLINHYDLLAKAVKAPIVIYNVPSRTGVNILPPAVIELAQRHKHIVAVKEASGVLDQASQIAREAPGHLVILCGDDSLTLPMLAIGARGVISVAANIAPVQVSSMVSAWDALDADKARRLHLKLLPIFKTLFIETNPVPVKTALKLMGRITSCEVRSPLVAMSKSNEAELTAALAACNIIEEAVR